MRYSDGAVLRLLAATVVASTLLLAPSMPGGGERARLLERSATAAEAAGRQRSLTGSLAARALAGADALAEAAVHEGAPPSAPVRPAGGAALHDVDAVPSPVAFGFGAKTPFWPSSAPRELVLSFDDGPDLKFTPLVLEELDRRGLKAIFFITGQRLVGEHPEDLARRELVRKISAHGHLVANHTMTHRNLCRAPGEVAAEIDGNAEMIAASTGVRPLLFRAPYGARCRVLEAALVARQLTSVGWNLDPQDWKDTTPADVLAYLKIKLVRLEGRGILLLHDTHASSVFALGPLLDWIAHENRRAVAARREPIVLRDYAVFLPERPVPATGLLDVAQGISRELPWGAAAAVAFGSP